jgi:hypothetical protein
MVRLKVEIDPRRAVKLGVDFPSLKKAVWVNNLGEIGLEDLHSTSPLERSRYKIQPSG